MLSFIYLEIKNHLKRLLKKDVNKMGLNKQIIHCSTIKINVINQKFNTNERIL